VQTRKLEGRSSNSRTCEKRILKSYLITIQPDFTSWQRLKMSFLGNDDGVDGMAMEFEGVMGGKFDKYETRPRGVT